MTVKIGIVIALCILMLLIGLVVGFLVTRKIISSHLKKNPPINETMIRQMMTQMGRTPSEKQVRQIMASMNQDK